MSETPRQDSACPACGGRINGLGNWQHSREFWAMKARAEKAEADLAALHDAPSKEQAKSIQRYDLRLDADQGHVFIDEMKDEDGEWVKWEDVEKLLISADPLASGGWQTIDSAPKDGTPILVLVNESAMFVCWFHERQWCCVDIPKATLFVTPTHWMPLPAPPLPAEPETQQTPQKLD